MLRSLSLISILFSFFLVSLNSQAQPEMRKTFLKAEKYLWQHKSAAYQDLYNQLHYYPLQPYLDQSRLINSISINNVKPIHEFLTEYENTPLDWPLRKKWLNYLAKRKKKKLFIQFYKPTSNVELSCQNYQFKLDMGSDADHILPNVTSLWIAKKSQPKVCDPLFKQWKSAGYLTKEVVWKRVRLAADGGDHTLLPYLAKLLPEEEKYLPPLWKKVRANPSYIARTSRFPNKSTKELEIISYGLKRLIWRDPDLALRSYNNYLKKFEFSEQQKEQITLKFALSLASKDHKKADEWLKQVNENLVSSAVIQWRIVNALRGSDWANVKAELQAFPDKYQQSLQWQYWYGRSLMETGDKEAGLSLLTSLAKKRHYYGFLASSHLSIDTSFHHDPIKVTEKEKIDLLSYPSAKRAFELFHIGRYNSARREWNYWLKQLDDRGKLVASRIAYESQWYDRPIFLLSQVGYMNDIELRFPLAYEKDITHFSDTYKIDPAWAFAIARRESSFMADANSGAGAKGVMQVMPNTAKQLKRKKISNKYLFDAKNNIDLRTSYLKKLLDRYDGNQVLATASYNAGPYRVSKWIKNKPPVPADIWIETIPFKETREYVKSVLAYQHIYHSKVGTPGSLFDEIINMSISQ